MFLANLGSHAVLVGILVGGASKRMGRPKGLLVRDGEPLLVRSVRVVRAAGLEPVLLGDDRPYRALVPEVRRIGDRLGGVGPIAGLDALLAATPRGVLLGCDMPYVEAEDLRRLASDPRDPPILAARRDTWEPLFARYDAARVAPVLETYLAEGRRSLLGIFDRLGAEELEVAPQRLDDWDRPDDLPRR